MIPVFRFADGFFGSHVPTGEIYEFVYWWHNSGLHSVCGTLGWALQATWHRETVHFIMARVKQALCTPAESLADTFRFAQFAYSMNHLHGSQPAEHHGTANIKVKAFGVVIFEGRVDASARLLQVQHLWSEACRIVDIPAGVLRFVHAGKQMNPEFRWCDFQQNETGPLVVHLQSPLEGGGKNFDKDGQTSMKAKNALGSLLLARGSKIEDAEKFAETAVAQCGPDRVLHLVSIGDPQKRWKQLQGIAAAAGHKLPLSQAQYELRSFNDSKRLSQREQVDPAQLVLEPGFFCTEEGAECTIHREVNAAKPGVVMLTPEIARPWFDETQAISQKELGLIVLSASCDCNTASCVACIVPVRDPLGAPCLVNGFLHELGAKKVCLAKKTGPSVHVPNHTATAFSIYRNDVSADDWNAIVRRPVRWSLDQFAEPAVAPLSPPANRKWLDANGKIVMPDLAVLFRFNCRLADDQIAGVTEYITVMSTRTCYVSIWIN